MAARVYHGRDPDAPILPEPFMKKPGPVAVLLLSLPFLTGCFTVNRVPVPPSAAERENLNVRGVVVRQADGAEEEIDFAELLQSEWTPTSYSVVATLPAGDNGAPSETVTRLFQISTLSALKVRQIEPGRTSLVVGGVFMVAAAIIATLVTGKADQYTF